jgi:hypothetical protein
VIERLHEEFRRRVKAQGSLPSEDTALILLFSLVASGQIKLRRIDGLGENRRDAQLPYDGGRVMVILGTVAASCPALNGGE